MPKTLAKKYFLHPYPYVVHVSIGQTDKQLDKFLDKHEITFHDVGPTDFGTDSGTPEGYVSYLGPDLILRVSHFPETAEHFSVLQHEIFHAVHITLEGVGITLSSETAEAYAYLIDYLTEVIYTDLHE